MKTITEIKRKYKAMSRVMDERARRIWAATEALEIGWGGIAKISEATGLARNTINAGIKELEQRGRGRPPDQVKKRIRKEGGGRKSLIKNNSDILKDLENLVSPSTRGDPESPLRWTFKSTRKIAEELCLLGHKVSASSVCRLLKSIDYSLQANDKVKEGASHPDRNAQFEYINKQTVDFQNRGQPVISVDAKKKELIGDFKNAGTEWRPKGTPEKVQSHDFPYKDLGKGLPYGVYDVTANNGWVSVGTDHDTAEFAVETIRRWWNQMGKSAYDGATELLIMADAGGSNASKSRLWKFELQRLSDSIGLAISVCHFPPGTSKWNKIEHRMFSHITQNWRGRPLLSHQVMVKLIGNTKTKTGLKLKAKLDNANYETGRKIKNDEFMKIKLEPSGFHGEWNYKISSNKS
jgi:hypothetical protein